MSRKSQIMEQLAVLKKDQVILEFFEEPDEGSSRKKWHIQKDRLTQLCYTVGEVEAFLTGVDLIINPRQISVSNGY